MNQINKTESKINKTRKILNNFLYFLYLIIYLSRVLLYKYFEKLKYSAKLKPNLEFKSKKFSFYEINSIKVK